MRIVSISEDKNIEKRISITPEIAKKFLASGFEITLQENYGEHLGFKDNIYSINLLFNTQNINLKCIKI